MKYFTFHTDFIPRTPIPHSPAPPPPPLPHSSASNMGDEADDNEYTDYDEEEVEFVQMQQSMLLNVSTLVQLWESMTNQSQGALVKQSRIPHPFAPHLSWEVFIAQQQQEDPRDFIKCLQMSIEAFEHLHSLLKVKLQKNKTMGDFQGRLIGSRLRLYLTIRYLGGGSIHDIHCNITISKPMSYTIIREVCVAMTQCRALRMQFPSLEDECREAARRFEEISFGGAIGSCVCVFDGYLLHTEQPRKKMVGNQRQYYSGHNCKFGVNIQAACDHHSRFLCYALAGPGSMNDKTAIHHCVLGTIVFLGGTLSAFQVATLPLEMWHMSQRNI